VRSLNTHPSISILSGQAGFNPAVANVEYKRCTDVMVNTSACRVVAHNEDWLKGCTGKGVLVDVHITKDDMNNEDDAIKPAEEAGSGETSGGSGETSGGGNPETVLDEDSIQMKLRKREERFVSYMVAGEIPGLMFSMNEFFVITINSLEPITANEDGVPVGILLRALLLCETIDECIAVMKNEPYGCFYGT